jgi:hypothetical protein
MTASGPPSNVTDLRSRRRYAPDLVSLACRKVASAREQAGLSVVAFAAELGQLLGWMPAPDLVRTWESTVAPPSHVVIACEVVASRTAQAEPVDGGDEVASAACDAEAEQSWLLTEPGPRSIESLWDEAAGIAKAANRSALQTFGASRRIHSRALMLAEQTRRPAALADLYVIAGQATALMASTAFDLNRWDESATLARSAVSYATLVGNASLQAWSLGLSALLANWRKEPDTALSHFRRGLEVAPPGTPRARLRYIAARPCWGTTRLSAMLLTALAATRTRPGSIGTCCARRPAANSRSAARGLMPARQRRGSTSAAARKLSRQLSAP